MTECGDYVNDSRLNSEEFVDFHGDDDQWMTRVLVTSPFSDLLSDWHAARQTAPTPTKLPDATVLTAEKMSPYLRDVSIFDCISDDEVVYRFVGTEIVERMGHDVTGENILTLTEGEGKKQVKEVFQRVINTPEAALIFYVNGYSSGRQAGVISLILPIQGPEGCPPRVVAVHRPASVRSYLSKQEKVQIGKTIDRQIRIAI